VYHLQPVGAAGVAIATVINQVRTLKFYQSTVSFLVTDFTYFDGRDGDIVIKELAAVDSHSNRVSSYVFKRPYGRREVFTFNATINYAIDHGCNWNDGGVLYSELETVVHRRGIMRCCNLLFRVSETTIYQRPY